MDAQTTLRNLPIGINFDSAGDFHEAGAICSRYAAAFGFCMSLKKVARS